MSTQLFPHIITDPDILSGKPIVEGTRVPVSELIAQVADGKSFDDVARDHAVSVEAVRAALRYGAQRADERVTVGQMASTGPKQSHSAPTRAETQPEQPHAPVSELGQQLAEIRARIVASGTPLLTWDEIDREMDEMRHRTPDEQ